MNAMRWVEGLAGHFVLLGEGDEYQVGFLVGCHSCSSVSQAAQHCTGCGRFVQHLRIFGRGEGQLTLLLVGLKTSDIL